MARNESVIVATGRRKTAIARVWLTPGGEGAVKVNDRTMEDYFPRDVLRAAILRPLLITDKHRSCDINCRLDGGGMAAQAGALAHGVSRALLKLDSTLRPALKKEGLLTRDPRMKERKKYGRKGARKRFQFSKR